jgi:hypothetical protein
MVSYKQENSEQFDYYSKHSGRFFFWEGLIQYLEIYRMSWIPWHNVLLLRKFMVIHVYLKTHKIMLAELHKA